MSKLSVVLPAYNEELMVGKTCRVLAEVLTKAKIPYELVVVNDGSGDRTWEEIQKAGERDANVTGVLFSRNFGKEAAIFAGLAQACGNVVAVMDCDLQHPPQTLIEMYRLWQEGYEVIEGVKADRGKEGFLHKECAGFFYDIMSKATGALPCHRRGSAGPDGFLCLHPGRRPRQRPDGTHPSCAGPYCRWL